MWPALRSGEAFQGHFLGLLLPSTCFFLSVCVFFYVVILSKRELEKEYNFLFTMDKRKIK